MSDAATHRPALPRLSAWQWVWLALAAATLVPAAWCAYADTLEAARVARVQLIEHYRLWETAPDYAGTPQAWTRFAAWLLDTDQLMERVRVKHAALAKQIELDFRRDLLLVCGRTIGAYLLLWLTPLAVLYGADRYYRLRRQR
jgi:hypothetical protein